MPFLSSLATFITLRVAIVIPVVNPLTNSGSSDIFVVKYNSSGTPLWARRIGGTTVDNARAVTTDSSGNIIVVGQYTGSVNIFAANGTTVLFTLTNTTTNNNFDSYVVKYDSSGTPLWARKLSSNSTTVVTIPGVSTDSSGNVYICGQYGSGTPFYVYAANGTTVALTIQTIGGLDAYIVKYDSSGTPLYARRLGGSSADSLNSICGDSSGNVIVGGFYATAPIKIYAENGTTVVFEFPALSTISSDACIVKYDSSGTFLWGRRAAGNGAESVRAVATDSSGNVHAVGNYSGGSLNFYAANGTTVVFTLASLAQVSLFIVKYDSSGTFLWARRIDGGNNNTNNGVVTDSNGNVFICLQYQTTVYPLNIYAADGTTVILSFPITNTNTDSLVVKYDSSGTFLWARRIGGSGVEPVYAVSTDPSGNVYTIGFFRTSMNFYAADGTTVVFTLTGVGNDDIFIVKYDSNGTILLTKRIGGTLQETPGFINVDSSGNAIAVGHYISTSLSFS